MKISWSAFFGGALLTLGLTMLNFVALMYLLYSPGNLQYAVTRGVYWGAAGAFLVGLVIGGYQSGKASLIALAVWWLVSSFCWLMEIGRTV